MNMDAISPADLKRIEDKVDKLADAVAKLVLFEERQANQGTRIGAIEQRLASAETAIGKVDSKVERWINRGIGAWAVAAVVFALFQLGSKLIGK